MRVVDMNNFSLPKESQHFLLLTGLRHAAEWLQGRYTIVMQPLDLPVNDPTADPDPGSDSCAICLRSAGRHRQGPRRRDDFTGWCCSHCPLGHHGPTPRKHRGRNTRLTASREKPSRNTIVPAVSTEKPNARAHSMASTSLGGLSTRNSLHVRRTLNCKKSCKEAAAQCRICQSH